MVGGASNSADILQQDGGRLPRRPAHGQLQNLLHSLGKVAHCFLSRERFLSEYFSPLNIYTSYMHIHVCHYIHVLQLVEYMYLSLLYTLRNSDGVRERGQGDDQTETPVWVLGGGGGGGGWGNRESV